MTDAPQDWEEPIGATLHAPPGFASATPVGMLGTHFVLNLVCMLGPKFNLRRDINDVLIATGASLFWPQGVIGRLQRHLAQRNKDCEHWKGCGELAATEFIARHGNWNGLYDDGSIFYYMDEYVKQHGKDLHAVFRASATELESRLNKSRILLADNIKRLGHVLGLKHAEQVLLLFAALIRVQRELRAVLVTARYRTAKRLINSMRRLSGATVRRSPRR